MTLVLWPGLDTAIEVDHVLIHETDAARGSRRTDRSPFRRAVQSEERILALVVVEIHRARAERVFKARAHAVIDVSRDFRTADSHFLRWVPRRPFLLPGDIGRARPGKALLADADAVTNGLIVAEHVVEMTFARVDDDRAGALVGLVADDLAAELRLHPLDRDRRQREARIRCHAVGVVESLQRLRR